jgi:ABC-type transport system involved in multi-copper enzyme maturation permease subunit
MIWLTWRQFRTQAVVVAAGLSAFAILLLVTGPHLVTLYRQSAFGTCRSNCGASAVSFLNALGQDTTYRLVYILGAALVILLPAVIGLFWGAPLISRELETGSFRLAWNQSVTRERWLAVKLGILGLASMAAAGLISLILGWWASPIDHAATLGSAAGFQIRFFPALFGARGIAPIGYAAFAFALGVLVGVIVRRTVPAMAITLAVFAAVQIVMPLAIRPHLMTPVRGTTAVTASVIQGLGTTNGSGGQLSVFAAAPNLPGAWIYSNQVVTASGSTSIGSVPQACQQPQKGPGFQSCATALAQMHLKQVVVYQPADRYWTFQWLELGIFLTVAVLLAWGCFWWVRRRLS